MTALGAGTAMAQDAPADAGLDMDLSGVTIKMATIGGQPYEAMYDSISCFEEATGATVEIVFLGDGFEIDRYLKTNYAAGTTDFDVAWNHTSFMSQYTNFVEPLAGLLHGGGAGSLLAQHHRGGHHRRQPAAHPAARGHQRACTTALDLFEDADLQAAFEAEYGYPLAPPTTLDQMYDMSTFFVGQGVVAIRHPVRRHGRGARWSLL